VAPRYLPVRHDWAEPFRLTREYSTDVQVTEDGTEVRAQRRESPNVNVGMSGVFLTEEGAGRLLSAFRGATQPLLYYVPLWCDASDLTTAVTAGAGTVSADLTDRPFLEQSPNKVMLWRDEHRNELVSVSSYSTGLLTLSGVTVSAYPLGCRVVPLRAMWLKLPVSVTWESEKIAKIPLTFADQREQVAFGLDGSDEAAVAASVEIYFHSSNVSGTSAGGQPVFTIFCEAIVYDDNDIPIPGASVEWTSTSDVTVTTLVDSRYARVFVNNLTAQSVTATSGSATVTATV
jgi:hypothetical protein